MSDGVQGGTHSNKLFILTTWRKFRKLRSVLLRCRNYSHGLPNI